MLTEIPAVMLSPDAKLLFSEPLAEQEIVSVFDFQPVIFLAEPCVSRSQIFVLTVQLSAWYY